MDYTYSRVTVWDNVGGAVRLARNARIDVADPATGAADPGLKQSGQPVSWVTTDGDGHATFTSTLATARLVGPRGFWQDVTSTTAILTTATNVATSTANSVAAAAITPAVTASATSTATSVATSVATDVATSTATSIATTAVTSVANSVAVDAVNTAAAQIVRADSHVSLDTDGVPYYDLSNTGTQVMVLDTDGVPYLI